MGSGSIAAVCAHLSYLLWWIPTTSASLFLGRPVLCKPIVLIGSFDLWLEFHCYDFDIAHKLLPHRRLCRGWFARIGPASPQSGCGWFAPTQIVLLWYVVCNCISPRGETDARASKIPFQFHVLFKTPHNPAYFYYLCRWQFECCLPWQADYRSLCCNISVFIANSCFSIRSNSFSKDISPSLWWF